MGSELKPCPFCAGAPQLDAVRGVTETWWVECLDCSSGGPSLPSEREAVRAWNDVSTATARAEAAEQRAEALAAEVARLRADALVLVGLARTAAIYDLNGPDTEAWGEALLLADGLSSADVAEVMRRVLRGVAESQPAEVSDV